jgi:hypothetical protein
MAENVCCNASTTSTISTVAHVAARVMEMTNDPTFPQRE